MPHRLADPLEELRLQEDRIARLSPDEYNQMFAIPINPFHREEEYGSDVDSNERYVQSFVFDGEEEVVSRAVSGTTNNNNTIGSREQAQRLVQQREAEWHASRSYSPGLIPGWRQSTARYVDDEVQALETTRSAESDHNNAYLRAAGSTDAVHIPARAPTVRPPPLTHRVPRLEDQDENMRARQREMFRLFQTGAIRQPSSSESEPTTDSGEYTIRDGSLPSSANFEGHVETNEPEDRLSTGTGATGYAVAAAIVAASNLPQADGATVSSISTEVGQVWIRPVDDNIGLWVVLLLMCGAWIFGLVTACGC